MRILIIAVGDTEHPEALLSTKSIPIELLSKLPAESARDLIHRTALEVSSRNIQTVREVDNIKRAIADN